MSFKDMKKSSIGDLTGMLEVEKPKMAQDERFWKPERNADDKGTATVRFMSAAEGQVATPWVQLFDHFFQGKDKQYYVANCPTTINGQCKVCEENKILWNEGKEDLARSRKRRRKYISSIYVVSDPMMPENEGKVFLYQYGAQVFQKIKDVMVPEFDDMKGMNPFDMWEGKDFVIRIGRNNAGWISYEKSGFAGSSAFETMDDKALESMWKTQTNLDEFLSEANFPSYEEQTEMFNRVTGVSGTPVVGEVASFGTAKDNDQDMLAQMAAKS